MAKRVVDDSSLTAVADAIRARTGTTEAMVFPDGFVNAVEGIPNDLELRLMDALVEVNTGAATVIKEYSFCKTTSLKKVIAPNVQETKGQSFLESGVASVEFPVAWSFGASSFNSCKSLKRGDFPLLRQIGTSVFQNSNLDTLILRNTTQICVLSNANALANTPIANGSGYIYVHRVFLSDTDSSKDYRRATNWSAYQFRAIEDYPEICGG